MTTPTLTTQRLTLRPPVESDFPALAAFLASPRTVHIGGPVTDEWEQWRIFLAGAGHWALKGYGFFTTLLGDTPIGRVGLVNHVMWPEPEIGWQIFDGHEGKGYVTEAARAVLHWAYTEKRMGPLISHIHPDNAGSRAVARRLGAIHESDTLLLGDPAEIWRHPIPETQV